MAGGVAVKRPAKTTVQGMGKSGAGQAAVTAVHFNGSCRAKGVLL